MIKIMKASAGSGKTFNLAKTYIRLLLEGGERYSYRHILAVTFTNKATDEMKSRILKELHVLSEDPQASPYHEDFLPLFNDESLLRAKAAEALSDILHDYGAFSVSTIDRFFQQTLKAFSREIGQFASYQVELDKDSLVSESVDRLLDSLSEEDKPLLDWLKNSVLEDLREGRRYNLEKKLKEVAMTLKSDEHRAAVEEYSVDDRKACSKENILRTKRGIKEVLDKFRGGVKAAAAGFVEGCAAAGIGERDFSGSTFSQVFAAAVSKGRELPKPPSEALLKRADDFSLWFRKGDRERFAGLEGVLMPLLRDYVAMFGDPLRVALTAKKVSENLNEMGIARELYKEFDGLLKEKNVLSLDDSNTLLRDIIDGSDAPFIYEKTGVRYEHFLLDEFQDTSRIQWDNFRPLLRESNDNGRENLLVGDVKQSIYRWRGSDWNMMDSEVQQEFPGSEVEPLRGNYRSLGNLVEFNNGFFPFAAAFLDSIPGGEGKVSGIYSDVGQTVESKDSRDGIVEALFCGQDEELQAVLDTVRKVHAQGARYGDVTVLVRKNEQGSQVAEFLMDNGIKVVSDDSLRLKSSVVVRQLVSLLSSAGSEEDPVGSYLAQELGIDTARITSMSLFGLCEGILRMLREKDREVFDSETRYIQSFMDLVSDHVSLDGNELGSFLRSWGESDPKISSPSDPDSVRVMTIHKAKGLEFQYVVFPFAEQTGLFHPEKRWVRPDTMGTELEGLLDGVYHVSLQEPSKDNSLFKDAGMKEQKLQFIDNINTFYVALTRAVAGMTVISEMPPQECICAAKEGLPFAYKDFSQVLYGYLCSREGGKGFEVEETDASVRFSKGTVPDFNGGSGGAETAEEAILASYRSWPLNPGDGDPGTDVRERGRLKFRADSVDFFSDEARADRSLRERGTVLHGILSKVTVPSDLPSAVREAFEAGEISGEKECLDLLAPAVASHPEWFPQDGSCVLAETSLVDDDGQVYRPDRVIIRDGEVTVVDYKFGEKNPRYRRQVDRYASIYRKMGYGKVSAAIWYVISGEVE